MSKLELIEDVFIGLDLLISFVAAAFKTSNSQLSEKLFLVSAVLLIVAFIAMVLKRVLNK